MSFVKVNFLHYLLFLAVFVTTGCVVGEIQAPPDPSGATTALALTSVSPTAGATSGGTPLTLTGTKFSSGMAVSISGVACSPVSVLSSTSATCTTGAHSLGTKNITITDEDENTDTLTNAYTYRGAPNVASFSPTAGSINGGTNLTIFGSNFFSGATVEINGSSCDNVVVDSSSQIRCTTSSGTAGAYAVEVTNDDGQTDSGPNFTYAQEPAVTSIAPSAGGLTASGAIVLTGTNFTGTVSSVSVGGVNCASPVVSTNVTTNDTITCTLASNAGGSLGAYDVTVTNSNGVSGTSADKFTYQAAPTVSAISPNGGAITTPQSVTITGTGFDTANSATVTIGGATCTGLTVSSSTTITCTAPSLVAGSYDVIVTNSDLGTQASNTLSGAYTTQPAPTITSLDPAAGSGLLDAGSVNGGTVLVITGTGFDNPTVTFGTGLGVPTCSVNSSSATSINCTTSAGAAGLYDVVVTNEDGQDVTLTNGYTFRVAPDIVSLSRSGGNHITGATINIDYADIPNLADIIVYFGPIADNRQCTGVAAVDADTFSCTAPIGPVDTTVDVTIEVQDGDKQTDSLTSAYTWQQAPTLTSISPNGGSTTAGGTVTLTGTFFRAGATVTIGGASCTSVDILSSTSLTCTKPAGTLGARDVVITNTDQQSDTLSSGFTYQVGPTLTSISPKGGDTDGGFTVTLTGSDFTGTPTVTLNGKTCNVTSANATTIVCANVKANAAGQVDVVVTNPDGQTSELTNGFEYQANPTISNISPPGGPTSGSFMNVTITGTGFKDADGLSVSIGGSACDSVTVNSDTEVVCDPPAGTFGSRTVRVDLNDGGSQFVSVANGYLYANPPAPTSITPAGGTTGGGTEVTITGTFFQDGATVEIGNATCLSVEFVSSTELKCATSSRSVGVVDVVVTNPDQQTGTDSAAYTYANPVVVSSVTADNGLVTGSSAVVVNGNNFVTGMTVLFGGNPCTVTGNTTSTINCTTPAGTAPGSVDVTVTNPDGQTDTLTDGFTYVENPTITGVSPGVGSTTGTDNNGDPVTITITGTNFNTGGATVTLNGTTCSDVNVTSSTQLTCTLQPGTAGNGAVVVTNLDGDSTSGSLANGFSYVAPPTITGVSVANGPAEGGTALTIIGTNFLPGGPTTVEIGTLGTCGSVNVTNPTTLTCTTSAGTVGTAHIKVINFDGQEATNGAVTFTYDPPPTVSSVSPVSGQLAGGTTLTITGLNFTNTPSNPTVTVGGNPCTPVAFGSSTSISCTLPAGTAGAADVVVENADGQDDTLAGSYTYVAAPNVTGVTPTVISTGTTTNLTITGTNFFQGTGPTITLNPGGHTCTSPVIVSSTQATCTAPSGPTAGTYEITLTNGDGNNQSDTTTGGTLNYVAPPTIASITPNNGPLTGGTPITINGTGYASPPLPTVDIGGTPCNNIAFVDANNITCEVPSTTTAGAVSVSLKVYNDIQSGSSVFTYDPPPTISSVSPTFGPEGGSTAITITGSNIVGVPSSVTIGGAACTGIASPDDSTITCTTGSNTTTDTPLDIVVTNADGQVGTGEDLYTYLDPPTISGVSPSGGKASGGETVTITGTDFTSTVLVTINGSTCNLPVVSGETTITCTSPNLGTPTNTYDLTVQNVDGQTDVETNAWQAQAEPTITNISPDNGDISGGTVVTLTGTNFESGATVFFDTTGVSLDGHTSTVVTVTAPSAVSSGQVNVTYQNPTGQSAVETNGYTYNPASAEIAWQVGGANPPNPALYSTGSAINQSLTFKLRNIGSAQSGTLTVSIGGTNSGAFFINSDTCSTNQLNPYSGPSDECEVVVIYLGAILGTGGSYSATLDVTDGATSSSNDLEAN